MRSRGNFGTGVRVSILKPTPIIYLAFNKHSLFIYLISQKVDLFIYCSLNLYTLFISSVICKQVYTLPLSRENMLYVNVKTKAKNMCIYMGVRKLGPFQFQISGLHILSFF